MATEKQNGSLPTISIKGKDYVLVKDRILYFNEVCPNGAIQTERISEGDREIVKAIVIPDCDKPERFFTAYSQAKWAEDKGKMDINIMAAMENAETSAVGRALAFMGIGVIESVASADEMVKAGSKPDKKGEIKESKIEKIAEEVGEKPWFNDEQLKQLEQNKEFLNKFNHSEDLIKAIREKYAVSKAMALKIADVWGNN